MISDQPILILVISDLKEKLDQEPAVPQLCSRLKNWKQVENCSPLLGKCHIVIMNLHKRSNFPFSNKYRLEPNCLWGIQVRTRSTLELYGGQYYSNSWKWKSRDVVFLGNREKCIAKWRKRKLSCGLFECRLLWGINDPLWSHHYRGTHGNTPSSSGVNKCIQPIVYYLIFWATTSISKETLRREEPPHTDQTHEHDRVMDDLYAWTDQHTDLPF